MNPESWVESFVAPMSYEKVLATLLIGMSLLVGCETPPEPPAQGSEDKPSLIFQGFTALGTRLGVKEWEASARTAQVYREKKLARAQQVSIRYFQKGQQVSEAKSDEAEINLGQYDIFAFGHVVLKASNGVMLYTERLRWDHHKQRITSDAWVKVVKGDSVLTGHGLVADRMLENVVVEEDVQIKARSLNDVRSLGEELQKGQGPAAVSPAAGDDEQN